MKQKYHRKISTPKKMNTNLTMKKDFINGIQRRCTISYNSALPNQQYGRVQSQLLWLIPLLVVVLVIGVLVGGYGWQYWQQGQASQSVTTKPTEPTQTVPHKPVLTVETVVPTQAVIDNSLSADGSIVPKEIASVNGKVNGVSIDKVFVNEGDWVKQGQVLAVFDTDAMQQQVVQAQADLAEAQTRSQLARSDAERVLPLLEIDAISRQEADRYVANANQAQAAVVSAQARLNNQGLNLNNAQVIAPVSGIISAKNADVGSVPVGQTPLFTIIKDGTLEWQAQVDPNKLAVIDIGMPVQVSLPDNHWVMGQVSRIAPTAEQGSRQISIYATLADNPLARAGMYQRGAFMLGGDAKQVLPVSAIVSQDGYDYVMLIERQRDSEGQQIYRVKRQKVNLGERQGDQIVIAEPLPENLPIVRQGGSFLNDGDVVRLASTSSSVAK